MPACVFCRIIAGEQPVKRFRRWDAAVSFEPLDPIVPGHTVVIPKIHVADALTDPLITATTFQHAAELARQMSPAPEGVNLLTSVGHAATQSVFHLHVHVVPRTTGDGLKLPWTDQQRSSHG